MIFTVKNMCIKSNKKLDPDYWIPYGKNEVSEYPNIRVRMRVLCFTRRGTKRFQPTSGHGGKQWHHLMGKPTLPDKPQCDDFVKKKMRIKDFIYGTLPRRNKKNKKIKSPDHVTVNRKWSRSRDLNKNCGFFPVEYNRHLVSEDFKYRDKDFETCNISYQLENFEGTNVCFSQDDQPVFVQEGKDSTNSSYNSSPVDGNFNTLPRIRSRIKTNPWLPSPKTSPGPSGATSPMTSSTVSNGIQEFFQDLDFPRESPRSTSSEEDCSLPEHLESGFCSANCTADNSCSFISNSSNLQPDSPGNCLFHHGEQSIDSTDHDSVMQNSFLSEEYIDTKPYVTSGNSYALESGYPLQFNYETAFEEKVEKQYTENIGSRDDVFSVFHSEECLDMDIGTGDIIDTSSQHESINTAINTKDNYTSDIIKQEFDTDAGLMQQDYHNYRGEYLNEHDDVHPYTDFQDQEYGYSTQSDLSQGSCYSLDECPSFERPTELLFPDDDFYNSLATWDEGSSTEQTGTLTPAVSPTRSLSFDLEDIEYIDAESDDDETATQIPVTESYPSKAYSKPVTMMDKTVLHNSTPSMVTSIQSSLCDRVRKLKQDKEVVDRIVNKAREEERLRKQELVRIQKEAALARKQILLKTLVDLRQKLDEQTDRLQSAYDNIITFRYKEAVQRKCAARI